MSKNEGNRKEKKESALDFFEEEKNFGQLKQEWLGSQADNINYCIPVCIGVVAQADYVPNETTKSKMDKALKSIVKYWSKKFGKFKKNQDKKSHHQLVVLTNCNNQLAKQIASYLNQNYSAQVIDLSKHAQPESAIIDVEKLKTLYDNATFDWDLAAMEEYCWATITAFASEEKMKIALQDSSRSNKEHYLENQLKFSITLTDARMKKYPVNLNKKANRAKLRKYKKAAKKRERAFQLINKKKQKAQEAGKRAKTAHHEKAAAEAKKIILEQNNALDKVKEIPPELTDEAMYDYQIRRFNANVKKIKQFNRKILKFHKHIDRQTKNIYDLLPLHHLRVKQKKILPLSDYIDVTNLREIFYDVISMNAQKTQKRVNHMIILNAGLALLLFSIYSDFPFDMLGSEPLKPFLLFFVFFMSIAFLVELIFVKIGGVHSEYLDFRALAEGMRVQCYWYAIDINESVGLNYIVKFDKDMQWIKLAFNAWYLLDYANKVKPVKQPLTQEAFDTTKSEWIDGQYDYYRKRSGQHSKSGSRYDIAKKWLFIVWSFFYIALFISLISPKIVDEPLIFLMGVVNILTMGITCASSIMADNELASKYTYCRFMASKAAEDYNRAMNDYHTTKNEEKLKEVFKRFGLEALEENDEWLMIKDNCQPEVPNG